MDIGPPLGADHWFKGKSGKLFGLPKKLITSFQPQPGTKTVEVTIDAVYVKQKKLLELI